MVGRILDWNFGERLLRVICGLPEKDLEIGIPIFWIRKEETVFRDADGSRYPLKWECGDEELQTGDVLTIGQDGKISRNYSADSGEVDIFVTNRCNSNCVMCPLSETVRRQEQKYYLRWLWDFIRILPDDVEYINITGGEPTLRKKDFLEILEYLKGKFRYSGFQLLTNGRSLADEMFLKQVLERTPRGMRFAIPLHASREMVHDGITQAKGSFRQTDRGIRNLLKQGQKVEIRVVISRKNIAYLTETAAYIVSNYPRVFCVNFIGMEMMGSAAVRREELWADYPEVFKRSEAAVKILIAHGIDVQLYNFPLCAVKKGYWPLAVKSITDYKVRYMPACDDCRVKEICGGFFASTKHLMKPEVKPVR